MNKEIIRYGSNSSLPLSKAIRAGDFLILSGQIPINENGEIVRGSIEEQTAAVMDRIAENLLKCNSDMSQVIKMTVYLSDINLFNDFNNVYRNYFNEGNFPARTTIGAKLAMGVDIEIEAQAWLSIKS